MNDNIEYEKFTQEIYNEILKNLYVKNIEVKHNVKLTGKVRPEASNRCVLGVSI